MLCGNLVLADAWVYLECVIRILKGCTALLECWCVHVGYKCLCSVFFNKLF